MFSLSCQLCVFTEQISKVVFKCPTGVRIGSLGNRITWYGRIKQKCPSIHFPPLNLRRVVRGAEHWAQAKQNIKY